MRPLSAQRPQFTPRRSERGVSLLVVLMILSVVTVLGLGGAQMAIMGERSARFERDQHIAMQAAELALADARQDILGPNINPARALQFSGQEGFETDCGNGATNRGLCAPSLAGTKAVWASVDFLETGNDARTVELGTYTGRVFDAGDTGVRPARRPRYIIEVYQDKSLGAQKNLSEQKKGPVIYRVTAMGFGPRVDAQAVLQAEIRVVLE